jgi:predicted DNA-binding protein
VITLSVRLTDESHDALEQAANRLGWSKTLLAKRAIKLITAQINNAEDTALGEFMTPLILTEFNDKKDS